MAKLTKKSYKRKRVLMGLALFMSIALVSTGFAAWVISSSVEKEDEGNVQVGTVTDKSIGLTVEFNDIDGDEKITDADKMIKFEPKKEDMSGRVRYDGKPIYDENDQNKIIGYTTNNYESLAISLKITVTDPGNVLNSLTIQFSELQPEYSFSNDGKNLATVSKYSEVSYSSSRLSKAASDEFKFIEAPDWISDTPYELKDQLSPSADEKSYTLNFPIEFKWGKTFDGINPGYYYDGLDKNGLNFNKASTGYLTNNRTVIDNLIDLRRTIYGIETGEKKSVLVGTDEEGNEITEFHYSPDYYNPLNDAQGKLIGDQDYLFAPGPKYKVLVKATTN